MSRVEDLGLLDKVFILVGVGPLRSAKSAEWMRNHVPGVYIPDATIRRLAGARDQKAEGRTICVELIQQMRAIKGVSGVHVMAYYQQDAVAGVGERQCAGAGQRGLAHAALAGEEEVTGVETGQHGRPQQHWPGAQPQSPLLATLGPLIARPAWWSTEILLPRASRLPSDPLPK